MYSMQNGTAPDFLNESYFIFYVCEGYRKRAIPIYENDILFGIGDR